MVWLWRKSQARSWFYGLIVMQVTSAFLVLWFDCGVSHKRVLGFIVWLWRKSQARSWFYGLIVAHVTSEFLVLWFDCCASDKRVVGFLVYCFASHKRVLGFIVWLWRKSQVRSLFYCLIVAEVTSEFLVLWFDCCASHKCVLGFLVYCCAIHTRVLGFMVLLLRSLRNWQTRPFLITTLVASPLFFSLNPMFITSALLVLWLLDGC